MPQLPDATSLGARPGFQPPSGVVSYRPNTGMEGAGADVLTGVGQQFAGLAEDFRRAKEHQDTLIAEDAYNKLIDTSHRLAYDPKEGFQNTKGLAAMGQEFFTKTNEKFSGVVKQLEEGLTDPDQKFKFKQRATIAHTQYRSAVLQHQASEMNAFNDNAEANGVALGLRDISLNWGDDAAFDTSLARIHGLIDARGQRKNLPVAETELAKGKALDTAWAGRIHSAMQADPIRALAMFRQHEMEMGPDSRIKLGHELKVSVMPVMAKNRAEAIITAPAQERINTQLAVAGEPLISALISAESNGDPNAIGRVTSGGEQARGLMQVLPSTAKGVAAKLGVPFDEKRLGSDAEYNKTIGTAYFNEQLTKYGGNPTLALAAYNAGPGRVDEWLTKFGDPRTGAITDADWAAKIPFKETREYVPKVLAKVGPGVAVQQGARDIRAQLADWESQARLAADKDFPSDPIARDLYVSQVKGYVSTLASAQEGKQRQAQGTLLTAAWGLDGGERPLTIDALLAKPGAREAASHLDPGAITGIMAVIQHNQREATGELVKSDPALVKSLFERVHLDEGDPNKIRAATQLVQHFGKLNRHDYDWLSREIDRTRTPEGNAFLKDVQRVRTTAARMMKEGIMGRLLADTQPEKIAEAAYRFDMALDQKVEEFRAAKKDPRDLITPGKPDYMLTPENISTFLPSARQTVGDKAAAIKAAEGKQVAAGEIKLPQVKNDADFLALKSGDIFVGPDGKRRQKP